MDKNGRAYYHSRSGQLLLPNDSDSDDEGFCQWQARKTNSMIDQFSDVNRGEKDMMKLWNLHVIKNDYIADSQLPEACEEFVDDCWSEILKKNLYRNFVLHLNNLFDYGFISPADIRNAALGLQAKFKEHEYQLSLSHKMGNPLKHEPKVVKVEENIEDELTALSKISEKEKQQRGQLRNENKLAVLKNEVRNTMPVEETRTLKTILKKPKAVPLGDGLKKVPRKRKLKAVPSKGKLKAVPDIETPMAVVKLEKPTTIAEAGGLKTVVRKRRSKAAPEELKLKQETLEAVLQEETPKAVRWKKTIMAVQGEEKLTTIVKEERSTSVPTVITSNSVTQEKRLKAIPKYETRKAVVKKEKLKEFPKKEKPKRVLIESQQITVPKEENAKGTKEEQTLLAFPKIETPRTIFLEGQFKTVAKKENAKVGPKTIKLNKTVPNKENPKTGTEKRKLLVFPKKQQLKQVPEGEMHKTVSKKCNQLVLASSQEKENQPPDLKKLPWSIKLTR